jgi:hypothetical protein
MARKGGLYVNFERVQSTEEPFSKEDHVLASGTSVIRIGELHHTHKADHYCASQLAGKKQYRLIKWK